MSRGDWLRIAAGVMTAAFWIVPVAGFSQAPVTRMHLHLDPGATTVSFTLKDTVHTVHGSFHLNAAMCTSIRSRAKRMARSKSIRPQERAETTGATGR